MSNIVPHVYAKDFLLGGRCKTTIHNTETGNQIRLFISAQFINDDVPKRYDNIISWKVFEPFTGTSINHSHKERHRYLGKITKDLTFEQNMAVPIQDGVRKFSWLWKHVVEYTIPTSINILHLGKCSVCNKSLEDAISLERGIGPVCYDHILKSKHYNK